jgi:hypothetical protein
MSQLLTRMSRLYVMTQHQICLQMGIGDRLNRLPESWHLYQLCNPDWPFSCTESYAFTVEWDLNYAQNLLSDQNCTCSELHPRKLTVSSTPDLWARNIQS